MTIKFSDIRSAEEKESERLHLLLEAHLRTRPAMEEAFNRADAECIQLASAVSAVRMAYSPKALESEGLLRTRRYERDHIRARWHETRIGYERGLERVNGPDVRGFHERSLKTLQNIGKLAQVVRDDVVYSLEGVKRIRISHNFAALNRGKQVILAGIQEVRGMIHQPLAQIRKRIAELETSFLAIDVESREITEVPAAMADDFKTQAEPGNLTSGIIGPGGDVYKVGVSMSEHVATAIAQMRPQGRK